MINRPSLDSMIAELKNKISDQNQDLRIRPRRETITAVSAQSKQALYLKSGANESKRWKFALPGRG